MTSDELDAIDRAYAGIDMGSEPVANHCTKTVLRAVPAMLEEIRRCHKALDVLGKEATLRAQREQAARQAEEEGDYNTAAAIRAGR